MFDLAPGTTALRLSTVLNTRDLHDGPEDLPTSLPAGVVNLVAEFSIDGVVVQTGGTYRLGYAVNTNQRLYEPRVGWREVDNPLNAGDYQAIGLDVSGINAQEADALKSQIQASKQKIEANEFAGLTKHDLLGNILQVGIVDYFAETWNKGQVMAHTGDVVLVRLPSVGTVSTSSTITYWFGMPRRFIASGVGFDVDRNAFASIHKTGDDTRRVAFNKSYNQILSAHEHSVLEELFSTEEHQLHGVSTVKALSVAAQTGQRIYTITHENVAGALSQLQLEPEVKTDIANAVNAGMRVITHQSDLNYADLKTAGYEIEDPSTGAGAMRISTGTNGSLLDWVQKNPGLAALLGIGLGLLGLAESALGGLLAPVAIILGFVLAVASVIASLETMFYALAAAQCEFWVFSALAGLLIGVSVLIILLGMAGGGVGAVIGLAILGFLVDTFIGTIANWLNTSGVCRPREIP